MKKDRDRTGEVENKLVAAPGQGGEKEGGGYSPSLSDFLYLMVVVIGVHGDKIAENCKEHTVCTSGKI